MIIELGPAIGVVTGLITIAGTIVAVTLYIARLQAKMAEERARSENERLQAEIGGLKKQNAELEEKYRTAIRAGSALAQQKTELENELLILSDAVDAERSCILVLQPVLQGAESRELVFLAMTGPDSENLKGVRVPLSSFAGQVFSSRASRITRDPSQGQTFSSATDQVSKATTREMLATPLFHQGACVGVAEFLNKRGGAPFTDDDREMAERLSIRLAARVGRFVEDPGNFQSIGITPRRANEEATVLFSDISGSSRLARQVDASLAVDIINEYFEELGGLALGAGATLDKFLGDGFMATFNVPRRLSNHQCVATSLALDMQCRFRDLAEKWKIFKIDPLYNRIGLTCGVVQPAIMGHSQFRHPTIMGDAVNQASAICEAGARDRDIVLVPDDLYRRVAAQFEARPFQPAAASIKTGAPLPPLQEVVSRKRPT